MTSWARWESWKRCFYFFTGDIWSVEGRRCHSESHRRGCNEPRTSSVCLHPLEDRSPRTSRVSSAATPNSGWNLCLHLFIEFLVHFLFVCYYCATIFLCFFYKIELIHFWLRVIDIHYVVTEYLHTSVGLHNLYTHQNSNITLSPHGHTIFFKVANKNKFGIYL